MSATTGSTHTLLRAEGFSRPLVFFRIEKQVGRLDGVEKFQVHLASGHVEVDHDPAQTSVEQLVAAVGKAGYKSQVSAF